MPKSLFLVSFLFPASFIRFQSAESRFERQSCEITWFRLNVRVNMFHSYRDEFSFYFLCSVRCVSLASCVCVYNRAVFRDIKGRIRGLLFVRCVLIACRTGEWDRHSEEPTSAQTLPRGFLNLWPPMTVQQSRSENVLLVLLLNKKIQNKPKLVLFKCQVYEI